MFSMLTWFVSCKMKVKVTRGQRSNKNIEILSSLYLAYSLKDYKIGTNVHHDGMECRTQNPGFPLKSQGHN
jgi:hypothetical protein